MADVRPPDRTTLKPPDTDSSTLTPVASLQSMANQQCYSLAADTVALGLGGIIHGNPWC